RDGDADDVARTLLRDVGLVAVADGLDVGALPGDGVGDSVGELGGRVHDAEGAGALLAQAGDLGADVAGGDPAHVAGAALDHGPGDLLRGDVGDDLEGQGPHGGLPVHGLHQPGAGEHQDDVGGFGLVHGSGSDLGEGKDVGGGVGDLGPLELAAQDEGLPVGAEGDAVAAGGP